jgi:hypothetical protein
MLRIVAFAAALMLAVPASAAPSTGARKTSAPHPAPASDTSAGNQCPNELASVDKAFADAMRDLQRNGSAPGRCTSWRRQIDVMKKASDVFARCIQNEARDNAISQMDGSISDFRAMIDEARCP